MTENPTSAACGEVRAWQQGKRLDPTYVKMQIEMLRIRCPDIFDEGNEAIRADMLEGETRLYEHLELTVKYMKQADAYAEAAAAEIAELIIRQGMFERRAKTYREHALNIMQKAELKNVVLPRATLSVRAGVAKVVITDETKLPDYCIRVKREPDKVIIKAEIEHGIDVPGATLSNAEPYLTIRVK
jgi:hypothetical protein